MKSCIAVLTRGYDDISNYSSLIKRNEHISQNLDDKTIDILIFHEGNITTEQQKYILEQTPTLNMNFVNISDNAFKPEKSNILFEAAPDFNLGYRHMCSFWFVDFWHYVKDYDFLLRIDEDCFINFNINNIFSQLHSYSIVSGKNQKDWAFVTDGLNNFTLNFIQNNSNNYRFKQYEPKLPYGPYTNVVGMNLNKLSENKTLQKYIRMIDNSQMIYKRRWGDLPLWGEAIHYILGNDEYLIDTKIKYIHGSHANTNVNS